MFGVRKDAVVHLYVGGSEAAGIGVDVVADGVEVAHGQHGWRCPAQVHRGEGSQIASAAVLPRIRIGDRVVITGVQLPGPPHRFPPWETASRVGVCGAVGVERRVSQHLGVQGTVLVTPM
jgi:hypothetical protein